MNCWIILLFLLCSSQNDRGGNDMPGCGCGPVDPPRPCRPRPRDCEQENERERERDCGRERDAERDSCPCGNESRFEPRFEPRPFNNSGCGCDDK